MMMIIGMLRMIVVVVEMTRRERELRVIVRRHGVVAAEVAKDTDVLLAWKIEVSTVIVPANF